jgi:hypothetical protein
MQIYLLRYYYADVDKTRQKIKEMIKEREWNTDEFPELKQKLLDELKIQYNSQLEGIHIV